MVRPRIFFDFSLENEPIGRVVFELFDDVVPKTVENFRCLTTGEKGVSPQTQIPLSYKGSIIHRSIANFMIQGGDFTKKNGTGGESIYGGIFADENFDLPVDAAGLLVMANRGANTNGSQFFITLAPCPHLTKKHVVFGRVVKGNEIITKVSEVPTDAKNRPTRPVIISNCGELVLKKKTAPPPPEPATRGRSISRTPSQSRSRSRPSASSRSPPRRRPRDSRSASPAARNCGTASRSRTPPRKAGRDKKKSRGKKSKRGKDKEREGGAGSRQPRQETEEELDARLEREENERIAAAKRQEAVRAKERLEADRRRRGDDQRDGIRFKGRGNMRYRDPDMNRRDY
ncbi:hypothetical protein DL93DRAFT_2168817 [Clavulina sp. PMI_390]|nr:hypothetical protein DL93DRAFT_2168817 [Clavulina sp. PMI_390]